MLRGEVLGTFPLRSLFNERTKGQSDVNSDAS